MSIEMLTETHTIKIGNYRSYYIYNKYICFKTHLINQTKKLLFKKVLIPGCLNPPP